jgi:hypothetical protein
MKAIALVFDYDLDKLKSNGRFWADNIYGKSENDTFSYSAASYATFLDKNKDIPLEIYTNNIDKIKSKLEKYKVNLTNVFYFDITDEIIESKKSKYTFQPIVDLCYKFKNSKEYIIKIDNDLVWNKTIPKLNEYKDVLIWKFERYVYQGDVRMGEQLVCENVCKTTNFKEYNIGVMGYPIGYPMEEFYQTCANMVEVDILPVSDLGVNVWHCCEQTAQSWIIHKFNYNAIETTDIVNHWYEDKFLCIEKAKYLIL